MIGSNRTELVSLKIGDLDVSKEYKFVAEGISGLIFKNESTLKIETKAVSIFIQTDKAIYKPGDSIKFRVLVLDHDLKPVPLTSDDKQLSIYVTDPEKNRIRQWLRVTPKKGVFSSEVQLTELAVLGKWEIEAHVGKESKTKDVEVAKYVLPNFDVTIDSANDFSAKDGKVRAIIRSKYTYGKLVKGEAIVSLTPSNSNQMNKDSVVKTIPINGKGTVEFDLVAVEFTGLFLSRDYEIKATVIEELTDRNQTVSKPITVHGNRYKFKPIGLIKEFTPGSPVNFSVRNLLTFFT